MPVERDSFQRHPVRAAGKLLTVSILGSALIIAGFIGLKYRKNAGDDKKVTDTSESRKDLDKLYGGNEPVKSELSQLVTVKSELTKLQFTLANKWKSEKTIDKLKGTEKYAVSSPDGSKIVTLALDYPQGLGGACPQGVNNKNEILEVEKQLAENFTSADSSVFFVTMLIRPEQPSDNFKVTSGLVGGVTATTFADKKAGDFTTCPGLLYNITNTKYLSPRDIVTPNENFSLFAGTGTGVALSDGYAFKTESEAKDFFASNQYQEVKQILTSVIMNP
jgi:hypothetical protein